MRLTRAKDVRDAVQAIRAFHRLGRGLPQKGTFKEAFGKYIVAREAEQRGTNEDKIRKARAFADPVAGYTPEEVDEMCGLIEAIQPTFTAKTQWVFRPSHVIRLLAVRPKSRRRALQVRAIRQGWSTARLEDEIAKVFGFTREGGRKTAPARTLEDWLAHTEKLCESWRRWDARLDAEPGSGDEHSVRRRDLPPPLRDSFRRASDEVRRLQAAVAREMGRRIPGYAPRPGLLHKTAKTSGNG